MRVFDISLYSIPQTKYNSIFVTSKLERIHRNYSSRVCFSLEMQLESKSPPPKFEYIKYNPGGNKIADVGCLYLSEG